jgi:peptidyl-prolyl cis-trans isomerase C
MVSKVNASHILVKTDGEAYVILQKLKAGASFEDLAKERSICPSRKKGGSLGWFGRNQMVKEFEQAAFSGRKGQIIGPVKTQFGWHLIRVDDTQ